MYVGYLGGYMRNFKNQDPHSYPDYHNPYYDPEKCGLEMLAVIDEPNMSYEYNTTIIVQDKETEDIYLAQDSGCSCPTPFEWVTGLDKMSKIANIEIFDQILSGDYYGNKRYNPGDVLHARKIVEENL
jgi:hypothetical protein